MADPPFGFGLPGDRDNEPDDPRQQPGAGQSPGAGGPLGPLGDPQQFADALRQFADLMAWKGGPVNWDLAKNVARHAVAAEGDPSVLDAQRHQVDEALRLADLWLGEVTTFPSGIRSTQAWSRSEWVEATLPVWSKLCDPIAARAVETMGGMFTLDPEELSEVPPEMRQVMTAMTGGLGGLAPMMQQIGGAMVGGQTGAAVGALAREVVSSTDVGLPLGPEGTGALLPAGIAEFGRGLSVPEDEVRLFLALREAAHQRLFAHVPWLRASLLGAVEQYARGMTVDTSLLRSAMPQVDLTNPEALREALAGGALFQPEDTPEQKNALARLETALALVEGWVATVVDAAAGHRLPHADALAEAIRRRRATGGPAERTFATLVGLELRPRRLREAAAIWLGLTEARGIDGRDALWAHPDLLPTAEDFDDPDGFVRGRPELDTSAFDVDAAAAESTAEASAEGTSSEPAPEGSGGTEASGTEGSRGTEGSGTESSSGTESEPRAEGTGDEPK
jgi:putative hydrolase